MRVFVTILAGVLLLGVLGGARAEDSPEGDPDLPTGSEAAPPETPPLGEGASPGNADGPGEFVPRGTAKCFYAAAGGRLWYYLNNYYWVSETAPRKHLWIKAEVVAEFVDLRRAPDGDAVPGPPAKVTVEYWKVGTTGRSVRLDNHKDYLLTSDLYTAGAITVQVTLTLGYLEMKDARDRWRRPGKVYVLESKNYADRDGVGPERTRFEALASEAVTVWGYRIPWDTHPQPLTRSTWRELRLPRWSLVERRSPPKEPRPEPVVTPSATGPPGQEPPAPGPSAP